MRKIVVSIIAMLLLSVELVMAQTQIKGTVTDKSGSPLPGVTVRVKGVEGGTVTGNDGVYTINAPANGTLVFSFIGMKNQEVVIDKRVLINVVLEDDIQALDEVVVIGYGSGQKLGSVVGSVSTVGAKKMESRPTANFSDALQGQVAGMQVFTSSGEPSASTSIRLRGVSTINASQDPLYLLDGMPISSAAFTMLNSNDIENVSVLKDASATAIYGSRAANGVVYITSKKGKKGEKAKIAVRAQYGFSMLTNNKLDMMNSKELFQFEEMCMPSLVNNAEYQAKKEFALKHNINTDWEDYVFKNSAPVYSIDASISGATAATRYYISLGYFKQDGTAPSSGLERYTFRSNIETEINKWFKVGANVGLGYQQYETSVTGWYSQTATMTAISEAPYNSPYELTEGPDGKLIRGEEYVYFPWSKGVNPLYYYRKNPNNVNKALLNGNTFLEIKPLEGLTIRAAQAIDATDLRQSANRLPSYIPNLGNGTAMENFSRSYQLMATNTIEYKKTIADKHSLSVLAGQEAIVSKSDQFVVNISGLTDDRLLLLSAGVSSTLSLGTVSKSEYVFNSYFGRVAYSYDDKYFLDGSIRTDGSSRFGKDNRYATFYSVGAMWNAKRESFIENVNWIDQLRVKASYGTTGNAGIGNYRAFGGIGSGSQYNGQTGGGLASPGNPDLTWETVKTLNIGIDGRVLNRIDFNVEFYNKKTEDMLLEIPYSASTGFGSGWGNAGTMRNRGIEVTLGVDIINNNDFYWSVSGNFNYNKNEILKLYNDIDEFDLGTTGFKYKVGKSVGSFYDVRFAGVDSQDGMPMWYDANGNLTKVFSDNHKVFTGMNAYANWSGGFSTAFTWKGFSLNADFSVVGERYMWLNEKYYTMNSNQVLSSNFEKKMLQMWTHPGQVTDVPKFGTPFNMDTSIYENAAFVRLKNLTLSYNFPKRWIEKTGFMEGARVYAIGRNLLTFTDFHGYDPEVDGNGTQGTYPNSRQYSFGVELTF